VITVSDVGRSTSSRVTATGTVKAIQGTVGAIIVEPTGVEGTVIVRDGGAGGTVKFSHVTPAAAGAPYSLPLAAGLRCLTDIHVTLTNCVAIIHYS
jgi:hypothetical protein